MASASATSGLSVIESCTSPPQKPPTADDKTGVLALTQMGHAAPPTLPAKHIVVDESTEMDAREQAENPELRGHTETREVTGRRKLARSLLQRCLINDDDASDCS